MRRTALLPALVVGLGLLCALRAARAAEVEREPIKMKMKVTNPSETDTQKVFIREPIPPEVAKRKDVLVLPPGLELEFDAETSSFYAVGTIELGPKRIREFSVELRDVWYLSEERLDRFQKQAERAMKDLKGSGQEAEGVALVNNVRSMLDDIRKFQNDDAIPRKDYIAGYRNHMTKLEEIQENIVALQGIASGAGRGIDAGMLKSKQETPGAPTTPTTWLIIFIILTFLGILTGAFYFVWQRRSHLLEQPLSEAQAAAFPESEEGKG